MNQSDVYYGIKMVDPRSMVRPPSTKGMSILTTNQSPRPIRFLTALERTQFVYRLRRAMLRAAVSFQDMAEYAESAGLVLKDLTGTMDQIQWHDLKWRRCQYNMRMADRRPRKHRPKYINGRLRGKRDRLSHRTRQAP